MQVDVAFDFAKVFDINRLNVVKGQKFTLLTDGTNQKWFADNDEVLEIKNAGTKGDITATGLGTSTILLMGPDKNVLKELTISVLESIEPEATKLNMSAEEK
jgi:hypothetical protein